MRDLTGWTIAFDLDGTLIDTAPDLLATCQAVLGQLGYGPVPGDIIRPVISRGSREMLRTALAHHGHNASEAELDEAFPKVLSHYRAHIADFSQPFPQLREVVTALRSDGAKVVVCTNKMEEPSRALLSALDMIEMFDAIAGRDTFAVHKPDPGHLTHVVAAGGGDVTRAVMVGDSDVDVATAKAAGIPVIGVTFGYTAIPVADLACDAVIDHYSEFDRALEGIIANHAMGAPPMSA